MLVYSENGCLALREAKKLRKQTKNTPINVRNGNETKTVILDNVAKNYAFSLNQFHRLMS